MKKLSLILALTGLGAAGSVYGGQDSGTFNVNVTLTPKCQIQSGSVTDVAFDYTAFQTTIQPQTTAGAITFECTRGFGVGMPTVELDTIDANGAGTGNTPSGLLTSNGAVGGLKYTITVAANGSSNGAAENGTGSGRPNTYTYKITGSIPAGQAGDQSLSSTAQRTLFINY